MAVEKQEIKSCCGSTAFVLTPNKALLKKHLQVFIDNGFSTSDHYYNSGIFFVQRAGLIATGPFGIRRLQVRCSQKNLEELDKFIELLDTTVNS